MRSLVRHSMGERDRWLADEGIGWCLVVVAAGVALDRLGASLVSALGLPLFFDTIGTIVVAALAGITPGVTVALVSTGIVAIGNPFVLYYASINVLVAVIAFGLSRRGAFTRVGPTVLVGLLAAGVCALIGGTLGWAFAGMGIASDVTNASAQAVLDATGWPTYPAQLVGELAVELPDKLLSALVASLVLRWLPKWVVQRFPGGGLWQWRLGGDVLERRPLRIRMRSLEARTIAIVAVLGAALGLACVIAGARIYENTANRRYVEQGQTLCSLASGYVDVDRIGDYLSQGEDADGYQATLASLQSLAETYQDVRYLYVYQVRPDGYHVVFDTDADRSTMGHAGDVVAIGAPFLPQLPALLAGQEIAPVMTTDEYGWLLSVYRPLRDSSGSCVAYVCADIDMGNVISDRVTFVAKLASIALSIVVLSIVTSAGIARRRVVGPVNALSAAATDFAFSDPSERSADLERLESLSIATGDEIEALYHSVRHMAGEATDYIEKIGHQVRVIERLQENTITSFADLTDARDKVMGGHIRRTARYVELLARAALERGVYPDEITPEFVSEVERSAPLHDIGKIEISDVLLNKPGKLTDDEYEEMKTHAAKGGAILRRVLAGIPDEDSGYLDTAVAMATYHHERWDGMGYPEGLSGTDIPLCARIMAVADVFDALSAKRPYKEGFDFDRCQKIMREGTGSSFDPALMEVWFSIADQVRAALEGFGEDQA